METHQGHAAGLRRVGKALQGFGPAVAQQRGCQNFASGRNCLIPPKQTLPLHSDGVAATCLKRILRKIYPKWDG
jgi:hypothetical protein